MWVGANAYLNVHTLSISAHKMAISSGIRHGRVIVDCELALRDHLDLEKVVPAMVDKKILSRKTAKGFLKKLKDESSKAETNALFVDFLKTLTLEKFGVFLTLVRSAEEEKEERPMMRLLSSNLKKMKLQEGSDIQKVVTDFVKAADEMPTSTQVHTSHTTKIEGSSSPQTNITEVHSSQTGSATSEIEAAKVDTTSDASGIQSCSSIAAATCDTRSPRLPFPRGFQNGCITRSFTREGGMLYSPVHGVSVVIPPKAVPSTVEIFVLGIYVYLGGPFIWPKDVRPCSPVVWFHLHPRFTFEADVTVKIPHCAAILPKLRESSAASLGPLFVLTVEEGQEEDAQSHYDLTRCIEADFSDGYHAVFTVRHFSPHTVVENRQRCKSPPRNRLGSSESSGVKKRTQDNVPTTANRLPSKLVTTKDLQKSGSLQDEEDELYLQSRGRLDSEDRRERQVDLKFYIARCMPVDCSRARGSWTVDFIISHFHPTGVRVSFTGALPNDRVQPLYKWELGIQKNNNRVVIQIKATVVTFCVYTQVDSYLHI